MEAVAAMPLLCRPQTVDEARERCPPVASTKGPGASQAVAEARLDQVLVAA